MSEISNVYDDIITQLETIFPDKCRIPNVYSLEDNAVQFLRNSWGLRVDEAAPTTRDFTSFSRVRNFTIVLTHEVLRTCSQTSKIDNVVKSLLESVNTLQLSFLSGDQFGSSKNLDIVNVGSFTGFNYFFFDKSNFLTTEIAFAVQVSNSYGGC